MKGLPEGDKDPGPCPIAVQFLSEGEMSLSKVRILLVSLFVVASFSTGAFAAGSLNAYAIMPEKYASQVFEAFTAETGIKVNFMRFS
ncbi:hypothetical protein [Aminirod propionatiphilus]|uniref:hypothetical protein n=1 Tax=Aminirod propionatiphilus TaxID=3415223 RepID=UPI003BFA7A48